MGEGRSEGVGDGAIVRVPEAGGAGVADVAAGLGPGGALLRRRPLQDLLHGVLRTLLPEPPRFRSLSAHCHALIASRDAACQAFYHTEATRDCCLRDTWDTIGYDSQNIGNHTELETYIGVQYTEGQYPVESLSFLYSRSHKLKVN